MEFYEPIDKEFFEIMEDECYNWYRHKNLKNEQIITFKFIEEKNQETVDCINEILKSETYAFIHEGSENEFVRFFSKIMLKYVDLGDLEW